MSQAGYTPIRLYYSTTAAAVPTNTNLADGELAINITDGKLFYKDNLGVVQTLASKSDLTTISFGTTGLTPSTATGGAVTVAGTLATTNGGTGLTTFTSANNALYSTSSSALTAGTLPVAAGGTGATSQTAYAVLCGGTTSTGAFQSVASVGTTGQVLTSNGAGALPTFQTPGGGFAAGTAMLFVQTAAPTGWTKSTTHNDKALRVVSGSASSGGTTAFSTVFTNQTPTITTSGLSAAATTLSTSQIPSHFHTQGTGAVGVDASCTGGTNVRSQDNTGSTGGGGSHTHSISGSATSSAITLNVQYVDVIIATKD